MKYGYNKKVNDLTESEKENISNWSQVVSGLTVGAASGGNIGDAGAAISASKNAVENNLLSNKYGVEKLDDEGKSLHDKLEKAGIGGIDELQAQYENCKGDADCRRDIRNEFRKQENAAGEKIAELYKSGQLSEKEFNYLVTVYSRKMLDGIIEGEKLSDVELDWIGDIYSASGYSWTPAGKINNPYLSAIRSNKIIEEWKTQGMSNEQIQEKILQDGIFGAAITPVDVNGILNLFDNGASKEDIVKFAALATFGKATNISKKVDSAFLKNPKQIKDVKAISAADANQSFVEKGWNAPYDSSTQVRQFTTSKEIKGEFVRVYVDGVNKPSGQFLVRADEIKGMTPQQIQQHLALPAVPTHMVDVTIPAGAKMQTGRVAPQPSFGVTNKGGVQYNLKSEIPDSSFHNIRPIK